ncbi:MAG TPA: alpha-amylase family glycosyl hydrolase [Rhizomicrobium sp.]|nr:alpha-amylase family glycosyl hydrolase [Rhizomicrobium sp.]
MTGSASTPGPDQTPWWRGAVIYQIYPRSFCDSNGDGVGDLPGITQNLEYVASLGVDAIWLSPFFASPMKDFGYDVSDYRAVDPLFGTLDDFDRLVTRAHDLGLKVIIDQVYAHTSDMHAWFQESRSGRGSAKADWYVWADPRPDGTPPNNWLSVFYGPCWTWDGRRMQYYMHNFLPSQPQLNVNNPVVQQALFDTARFWLDRNVDGFRLDAINFVMHDPSLADNPPVQEGDEERKRPFDFQHHLHNQSQPAVIPFIESLAKIVISEGSDRFTVAEVGGEQALAEMKAFTAGNSRLNTSYGFDFLYAEHLSPSLILDALAKWPGTPGEGWPSWAFSNHDAPRAVSRWDDGSDSDARAKVLLALLMCLRGNVFLYQGEELGLTQAKIAFADLRDPEAIANWPLTQGRDGARTPMPWTQNAAHAGFSSAKPWLPIPGEHVRRAVSVQNMEADSVLMRTRELLELRRSNSALKTGCVEPLALPAPLLGFDRVSAEGRVRCLFNLGAQALPASVFGDGECLFSCGDVNHAAGILGPWSACISVQA